jgi:hypothetical protein
MFSVTSSLIFALKFMNVETCINKVVAFYALLCYLEDLDKKVGSEETGTVVIMHSVLYNINTSATLQASTSVC